MTARRSGDSGVPRKSARERSRDPENFVPLQHGQVSAAEFGREIEAQAFMATDAARLNVQAVLRGRTLIGEAGELPFAKLDFTDVDLSHVFIERVKQPLVSGTPSALPETWSAGQAGWALARTPGKADKKADIKTGDAKE